jgi:cytochrome b
MSGTVKVWDRFVRIFHWSTVTLALTCLMTEDEQLSLHVLAGYTLLGLLMLRIAWGFAGPPSARFANFYYPPSAVWQYLRALLRFRSQRYVEHSPAGGAMIIALLVVLFLLGVTGVATYAAEEQAGPLAALLAGADLTTRSWLAGLHHMLANVLWVMIFAHLAGVGLASFAHRENLVWSMITGVKRARGVEQTPQTH